MLRKLIRAVLVISSLMVSLASAQYAAVWNFSFDETNYPMAAMDSSSNMYVVTREGTQTHAYVYLTKVNGLGAQVFRKRLVVLPASQLIITGVQLGGGQVYISYYQDSNGFPSAGYIAKCDMATGTIAYNTDQGSSIPYALCYKNGNLVSAGLSSSNVGFVRFVETSDGNSIQTWSFTANYVRGVDLTSGGVAFAAGGLNTGGGVLARVGIGGVDWTKNPDWTTHNSEGLNYVGVDEINDRVYALGSGYYGSGGSDLDCLVAAYDMSTGLNETKTYFGGSNYDEAGALKVDPTGRLYIAWYEDISSSSYTHVLRLDKNLSVIWSKVLAARGGHGRDIAFDGLNYVYVCDESTGGADTDAEVTKFHPADGTIQYTMTDNVGVEDFATQVFADVSGNVYICGMWNYPDASFVARMQFAQFVFTSSNVIGGATLNGKLRLHQNATSNIPFTATSSNPSVLTIPGTITVTTGTHEKAFTLASTPVGANTNVTITAKYAGNTCAKTISVLAPLVSSLSVTPNSLVGGNGATGTVNISGKAPVAGKVVVLSSSQPGVATVPANVTVASGATSKTFAVATVGVSANVSVVITGTTGSTSKTFFMAVNAPALTSFTLTPSTVKGGNSSTLTIGLDGKAPSGGWKVFTYSGAPSFVTVPASVTVPVGTWSKTASLTTVVVTTTTPITIFGARGGVYKTATLTLTP